MKNIKKYVIYTIVTMIFNIILFPVLLLYTPFFRHAKKVYVESAMCTTSHQWLAINFLSNKEIDNILRSDNKNIEGVKSNYSNVHIQKEDNSKIDFFQIKNTRYIGYGLVVHNPRRVKVVASQESGTKGETIERIAEENKAVCGVNGGGFSPQGINGSNIPTGIILSEGKLIYPDSECKVDLTSWCVGAIDKNGMLIVGKYTFDQLKKMDVQEAISFGPILVKDGKAVEIENNGAWGGGTGISQRTFMGQRQDGAIILVVTEGIIDSRLGTSLYEAQQLMLDLGAVNAINLDGGNSVVMYKDGQVINKAAASKMSRNLSSVILIK